MKDQPCLINVAIWSDEALLTLVLSTGIAPMNRADSEPPSFDLKK